jgi:uracil-DNA glycosylase family 4
MKRCLGDLSRTIVACRLCPRLVLHRERVAREKKRAFRDHDYWGRPVPGFGDPEARLLVVGLAPAAHGANRTGRMFTGDSSGAWLFRALHGTGFASQPTSTDRDDGLVLHDAYVTAVVRCAPPDNKPERAEIARCAPYLAAELEHLEEVRVIVALGQIAFRGCLDLLRTRGVAVPRPAPAFRHGAVYRFGRGAPVLLGSYHPSRQNTQTGRLTRAMLESVFGMARAELKRSVSQRGHGERETSHGSDGS